MRLEGHPGRDWSPHLALRVTSSRDSPAGARANSAATSDKDAASGPSAKRAAHTPVSLALEKMLPSNAASMGLASGHPGGCDEALKARQGAARHTANGIKQVCSWPPARMIRAAVGAGTEWVWAAKHTEAEVPKATMQWPRPVLRPTLDTWWGHCV